MANFDEDYVLALQLQEQMNAENTFDSVPKNDIKSPSLVDPYWEMTDPNPDVRALFLQFNDRFFWGKLAGIEVRWSPRMTLYVVFIFQITLVSAIHMVTKMDLDPIPPPHPLPTDKIRTPPPHPPLFSPPHPQLTSC